METITFESKYQEAVSRFDTFSYSSNDELFDRLEKAKEDRIVELMAFTGKRNLGEDDVVKIMIEEMPIVKVQTSNDEEAVDLALYDFDSPQRWTVNESLLGKILTLLVGGRALRYLKPVKFALVHHRHIPRINIHASEMSKVKRDDGTEVFDAHIDFKNGRYYVGEDRLVPYKPSMFAFNPVNYDKIDALDPEFKSTFDDFFTGLSNRNAERSMVMRQILLCAMIGFNPGEQAINLYGQAGGGKSTFINVLVALAGGEKSHAKLNYSDLNKDDALESIGRSQLIIGFDNDDRVVIRALATLKTLLSKEPFTFFRKFEKRGSNVFNGLFVQAFNEMPEFLTGSSNQPILDRMMLVIFEARFRHTENEIKDYASYLTQPHVLSQLAMYLLEHTEMFGRLISPDTPQMENELEKNDVVKQYVEELELSGAFANEIIPTSHLYAHFVDWFQGVNKGGKLMSQRLFNLKVGEPLAKRGFVLESGRRRPSSLKSNEYMVELIAGQSPQDNTELSRTIDNNYGSTMYVNEASQFSDEHIIERLEACNDPSCVMSSNDKIKYSRMAILKRNTRTHAHDYALINQIRHAIDERRFDDATLDAELLMKGE